MDDPHPPRFSSFPQTADKPDGLLAELLNESHIALVIAERHIRLWRANSATGNMLISQHLCYVAHEALHEAGKAIDCIAEMLRIDANGTLATHQTEGRCPL